MFQHPDSLATHPAATLAPPPAESADSAAQDYATTRSHWPVKVDSLLRPEDGHDPVVEVRPLPKYYKETFFARDSLLHAELHAGRYGMPGDPVPYSVRGDNVLAPVIIASVLLLMYCVKRASRFLLFQGRNFWRVPRPGSALEREAGSETRHLLFAEMFAAMVLALVFYNYTKTYVAETYVTYSEYTLMAIYLGCVLGLILFEHTAEKAVNAVFFTPYERTLWTTTRHTIVAAGGLLLAPLLLLMAFFGLPVDDTLIYAVTVVAIVKTLLFFKLFQIFFSKRGAGMQIFLYFCTLEAVPPLVVWAVMVYIANILKVNYQ